MRDLALRKRGLSVALGAVAALVTWLAPSAAQARPHHQGFTGDLGLGVAVTAYPTTSGSVNCSSTSGCTESSSRETEWRFGIAPLSLSLGGFIVPKVALLGRAAGTVYFRSENAYGNNFYGPILEVWPIDEVYFSGGVGVGLYGPNPLIHSGGTQRSGFALDFRVGAALVQGTNHDFTLSVEVIPGFYDSRNIVGTALVGAWKWY